MPLTKLGEYSVSHLQVLDEHGKLDEALEPKIETEKLIRIYRSMVLAREVDQRALKLQRQGRIGTFGPATGQEASSVGPAFAMTEKDWFVGSFRELGGWLVWGMPIENFFLFHNGYEEGNVFKEKGRTLPISIIVGSQTLHAVGIGYAMKVRGEKNSAAVTFFGDGATSQGDFHEALNFAGVWKAPVVFVCQNNGWAISIPREKQTSSKTLAQKAIAYDIPGIQVDGNDVLAMIKATSDALDRAHAGGGPTLIEAVTYRMMMHTTADDPTRYRTDQEVDGWKKRDPIDRFRVYLQKKDIWNDDRESALQAEIKKDIEEAVARFEAFRDPKPDTPFDHVFGTPHAEIESQRAEFLAHLPKEAPHGQA